MKIIKLYTDGGARGNPGSAATGVVLKDAKGTVLKTSSRFLGRATNNIAEYSALLEGLKIIQADYKDAKVVAHLDSELIVKQMKGEYRVKDIGLKQIYTQVQDILDNLNEVEFKHIRREKNSEADALVNQTLDGQA